MNGSISDMLAVAQALARSKEADDALKDALSKLDSTILEQNTALAEILAAMEKPKDEKGESEALGKAIAAALLAAIKNMPAPILKMDMPAAPAAAPWKTLSVRTPKGENYVITRN